MSAQPFVVRHGAVALAVRLTPKAARDEIEGAAVLADGRAVLKARVRALPQDGEANAAVIRLLAKALKLPASSIHLESGATSRVKIFILDGDPERLAPALAAVCAPA
ncbi:DUF167 family protein [Methylocella sp.]|uniref:DUF167 family protein n=1 Tax=Methylocella sp. TaxID=1978226 RepID=UPI0037834C88